MTLVGCAVLLDSAPEHDDVTVPDEPVLPCPSGHTIGTATLVLTLGYLVLSHRVTAHGWPGRPQQSSGGSAA